MSSWELKPKKEFKVVCIPKHGELIEITELNKSIPFLYRTKKQGNLSAVIKRGDIVTIENGYVTKKAA